LTQRFEIQWGKKDRYSMLSSKLEQQIKDYIACSKTGSWLFEDQSGGKYSDKSVQQIMKKQS
jgi:hypothetical protein